MQLAFEDFNKAIAQLFPELDEKARNEVQEKVLGQMVEFLKRVLFKEDEGGINLLNQKLEQVEDIDERSKLLGQMMEARFESLPKPKQDEIMGKINKEAVRIMEQAKRTVKQPQSSRVQEA